jgi:hypothetical protein
VIFVFYAFSILGWVQPKRPGAQSRFRWKDAILFIMAALLSGGSWFLMQIMNGHFDMVMKFIQYQVRLFTIPDAGHGGHWSYHFWVLLVGVFPASVFALRSFGRNHQDNRLLQHFHLLMLILFWVVLILFSIVKTKIVHYSSLCYFPLTFLAALSIARLLSGAKKWNTSLSVLLITLSTLLTLLVVAIPILVIFRQEIIDSGMIKDAFTVANLQADVSWGGWEAFIGLLLLPFTIAGIVIMKKQVQKGILIIFASSLIFTWTTILVFPYRIEQYSQRAAIEFFKEKAKEDCYVLNAGYFSYAPLFYGQKMPDDVRRPMWLLTGDIDRPFYLILKEPEYEKYKHVIPAMKVLYRKNGFVFLRRMI